MDLTPSQSAAMAKLRGAGNVFLTGAAGTGKSTIIRQYMIEDNSEIAMLATTGMAAIILNGRTFHAFFSLWDIFASSPEQMANSAMKNYKTEDRVANTNTIVIDEVSMLDERTMLAGEMVARRCRGNDSPWGGLRVIAVGDFCQLPPVDVNRKNKMGVQWVFDAPVWKQTNFEQAELIEIMRTGNVEFMDILNKVRRGVVDDAVTDFLRSHTIGEQDAEKIEATRIFGRRREVDSYNAMRMSMLDSPWEQHSTSVQAQMFFDDDVKQQKIRKKLLGSLPVDDVLTIKKGALVMIRKNNLQEGYANGSLGHYLGMKGEQMIVELLDGREIMLDRYVYEQRDGEGNVQMSAQQFPMTVAYASTIHKVQGATLDSVVADLGRLWDCGQAYVAMSRTKTAAGFHVLNWSPQSIIIDQRIKRFYNFAS